MTYTSLIRLFRHYKATQFVIKRPHTDCLWQFWFANEVEGCNYSWLEIRLDTLHVNGGELKTGHCPYTLVMGIRNSTLI